MQPNEYQEKAMRTQCPQAVVLERLAASPKLIGLLHACIGLAGEVGELATAIQRWLWYGKGPLDVVNCIEEFGDVTWYTAEGLKALEANLEDVMVRNIAKLAKRYPDKFSEFLADEVNRDRAGERKVLEERSHAEEAMHDDRVEQDGHGFGHVNPLVTVEQQPHQRPKVYIADVRFVKYDHVLIMLDAARKSAEERLSKDQAAGLSDLQMEGVRVFIEELVTRL